MGIGGTLSGLARAHRDGLRRGKAAGRIQSFRWRVDIEVHILIDGAVDLSFPGKPIDLPLLRNRLCL